jgi:hypothetical protein
MATQWWVRPRLDGGCDYVRLRSTQEGTEEPLEWIEGSHLPPQLPLLKRRCWVTADTAEHRRDYLMAHGYQLAEPVF